MSRRPPAVALVLLLVALAAALAVTVPWTPLPGSTADNDAWFERKGRVVQRYGASSFLVGRRLAAKGQRPWTRLPNRSRRRSLASSTTA